MRTDADSVDAYLAALPDDRREMVGRLREVVRSHLPDGYAEGIQYGAIGWNVPHSRYPDGYHCDPRQPVPFVGIASQKAHVGLYLFCIYVDPELTRWFVDEYAKTGKKLDMGKGCVRFRRLDDIPFDLVGRTVARIPLAEFLARYEAGIPAASRKRKRAPKAGGATA